MGIVGSQGFGGGSGGTFVQENSDWNATTGVPEIFNKPDLSVFTQGVSLGNILFVSSQAPASNNSQTRTQALGRIDRPFRSIQSALNVCDFDDVIYIFTGVYNENISCNKAIKTIFLDNCTINGTINLSPTGGANTNKIVIQGKGQAKITSSLITLNGLTPLGIHFFEFRNLEIIAEYNYNNSETGRTVSYFDCKLNKTADYVSSTYTIKCYDCTITNENKNKGYTYHEYWNCDVTYENGTAPNFSQSLIYMKDCSNVNFGDYLFTEDSPIVNLYIDNCNVIVGKFRKRTFYSNQTNQIFNIKNSNITETDNSENYIFTHTFILGDWYLGNMVVMDVKFCTSNKPIYDTNKQNGVIDKINFLVIE